MAVNNVINAKLLGLAKYFHNLTLRTKHKNMISNDESLDGKLFNKNLLEVHLSEHNECNEQVNIRNEEYQNTFAKHQNTLLWYLEKPCKKISN